MEKGTGYFENNGKLSKVTEDGLRINVFPSGIVTSQVPGETHSAYKAQIDKNFKDISSNQMSDFAFNFFKK